MATTSAQRVRAHRTRRRRREVQLTIEVSEIDLREIALRSYADATSTDPKAREVAVALFVSVCVNRDRLKRRPVRAGRARNSVTETALQRRNDVTE